MFVLFLRTILVYFLVILAVRIMGKRQLGELQPNELVVTIIISNIATLSLQDNTMPLLGTVLPIFTLVSCEVMISFVALKSVKVRRLMSGNPLIVIRDGHIDQQMLRNLRWTIDDLLEQLRTKDIFDITEVSMAIVETSGTLSIYQKFSSRPVTAQMMSVAPPNRNADLPPVVLISDRNISEDGLRFCGIDKNWLENTLKKEGHTIETVFLMTCDSNLCYHIYGKEEA